MYICVLFMFGVRSVTP